MAAKIEQLVQEIEGGIYRYEQLDAEWEAQKKALKHR